MCIHKDVCRYAPHATGKPPDRRYHTVLIGDLIIYVQCAREESERTGQPFGDSLAMVLAEELGGR